MANDRVFIQCKTCGGWKMLLKFFPGKGAKTRDNGILDFLDAHAVCHPHRYSADLAGDPGFKLFTEDKPLDLAKQNMIPTGDK